MTEFRTKGKGKERKVYPVKKQAYGISRELAYKDVTALRDEGKKARLIRTNRKLDLYAPYVSDLPGSNVTPNSNTSANPGNVPQNTPAVEPAQPLAVTQTKEGMSIQEDYAKHILNSLGILNNDGKSDLKKSVFNDYITSGLNLMKVQGRMFDFTAIDYARTSIVTKKGYAGVPDGDYIIKEGSNGPEIVAVDEYRAPKLPKLSGLDYTGDMTAQANLNPQQTRDFIKAIQKAETLGENVRFQGNNQGGIDIIAGNKETIFHIDGTDDKKVSAMRASYSPELLTNLLKMMIGNKSYRNPNAIHMKVTMKTDYPMSLDCSEYVGVRSDVHVTGLLAPRME